MSNCMKKALSVILAAVMLVFCFVGCSKDAENSDTTIKEYAQQMNAVAFIEKNYSPNELGLSAVESDYSLMANGEQEYEGEKYFKVVAAVAAIKEGVTSEEGKQVYSMEIIGEYLVSKDMKKVFIKDMENDTYSILEAKQTDYSQKEANSEKAE